MGSHYTGESSPMLLRVGRAAARHLPRNMELKAIGQRLGMSPQLVEYYSLVALGKLVVRMRKAVGE